MRRGVEEMSSTGTLFPNSPTPYSTTDLKGRRLLSEAKTVGRSRFGVLTGDTDSVVPVRASRRVAELLGVPLQVIERCVVGRQRHSGPQIETLTHPSPVAPRSPHSSPS